MVQIICIKRISFVANKSFSACFTSFSVTVSPSSFNVKTNQANCCTQAEQFSVNLQISSANSRLIVLFPSAKCETIYSTQFSVAILFNEIVSPNWKNAYFYGEIYCSLSGVYFQKDNKIRVFGVAKQFLNVPEFVYYQPFRLFAETRLYI